MWVSHTAFPVYLFWKTCSALPVLQIQLSNLKSFREPETFFLLSCLLTMKGTIACLGNLLLHRLTAEYLRCKCFISTGYPSCGHCTSHWHLEVELVETSGISTTPSSSFTLWQMPFLAEIRSDPSSPLSNNYKFGHILSYDRLSTCKLYHPQVCKSGLVSRMPQMAGTLLQSAFIDQQFVVDSFIMLGCKRRQDENKDFY